MMEIVWRNHPDVPNSYARVEAPRRPTDDLDILTLTERALEAQNKATHAQRTADELRSALFRRRKQAIAAGMDVPDSSPISGLPGWREQQTGELIMEGNAQIDREAARRGVH